MRNRPAFPGFDRCLSAVLAMGLALLAWAHAPSAHREPLVASAGFDLAAYTLPDGTLPELCLVSEDGEEKHQTIHCPICVIGKTFAPVHLVMPPSQVDYREAHFAPIDEPLPTLVSKRRANAPRGPPTAALA